MNTPPSCWANSQLNRAVRRPPTCRKPVGLGAQVAEILTHAILEGQFKGGDQLIETDLQAPFGISRSPLREALRELEKKGLVVAVLAVGGAKPPQQEIDAAKAALIGNTAPVAYGSVGIPIITLAKVTGLDEGALSAMVGRQLPFFALLVPFWLVAAQAGWRGMLGVWPACLVTGASFAVVQFLVSNYHGPYLVDAAAGIEVAPGDGRVAGDIESARDDGVSAG